MTRLTNLKPSIGSLPTRVGAASQDHDRQSSTRTGMEPWQAWYKTSRWQKLRLKVLVRDAYTCRATGAICIGHHHAPNSPVVDHIRPHHGNEALFWSIDNLQTVTKEWTIGLSRARSAVSSRASGTDACNPRCNLNLNPSCRCNPRVQPWGGATGSRTRSPG